MPDGENISAAGYSERKSSLGKLRVGDMDELGNTICEILWFGMDYVIYRSEIGVSILFSPEREHEEKQRERFITICPELCELRYLTSQMDGGPLDLLNRLWLTVSNWLPGKKRKDSKPFMKRGLYDHNIAQALMLAMEGHEPMAKSLAGQALSMAVRRTTNDNTIRYVTACLGFGVCWILLSLSLATLVNWAGLSTTRYFLLASAFGAAGAVFSIITRVESFQLKPCQESGMNYWMSVLRVFMGVMSGVVIVLLAGTILTDSIHKLTGFSMNLLEDIPWPQVALFGFLGGFAERLIPNILQRSAEKMEGSYGTPAQAMRAANPAGAAEVRLLTKPADHHVAIT